MLILKMNTESSFKFQFKKHRISQVQFSRREQDVSMREGIIAMLKGSLKSETCVKPNQVQSDVF